MNPNHVLGDNNGGENDSNKMTQVNTNVAPTIPVPVSRGGSTSHIFYKTRICKKFLQGNCPNGDTCTFAHGSSDLRQPPPNWQQFAKDKSGKGNDDQNTIQRRICWKFYNGIECPYGQQCNFLHGNPTVTPMDMGRTQESSVINIQTHVADRRPICSHWKTTGQCVFADKCHFAHGLAEIQMPVAAITESHSANSSTAVPQQQVKGRGFAKLRNKKLNGIYGDWPYDDLNEEEQVSSKADSVFSGAF